ncbi:hypothetical protein [Stieleria marina]|uniref:Tetratricopeptide repeat protein n=1 Tax=Stieleria marina TaxID=1930275 RepID=A0A517NS53_9BACT|nr:hypothetical protein K239x_18880 [Planctomycetes bacterium K23_9]
MFGRSIISDHSRIAILWVALGVLLCGMSAGCATSPKTLDVARDAFAAGDILAAEEILVDLSGDNNRISAAAKLDLAMIELASGKPKAAEASLRQMRGEIDALPKVAPIHEAASILTDDLSRVYRPAGYEEVMIRTMLAVCSLSSDQADAESYALQAAMRQSELASAAEARGLIEVDEMFQPIAIAPYLRGILREATHHDYDDAARAYQLVSDVRPDFAPVHADIARASGGTHSSPGNGVLYVLGCVGRGPVLEEGVAETTTAALSIASQAISAMRSSQSNDDDGEHATALPNIASVKVPRLVLPPSSIATLATVIDGQAAGNTQTLTDVSQLAANQISAEMPWTIARAVVRRATKEAMVAKAGQQLGLAGQSASIFQFAAGTVWSSTEKADTRCWGMLPREIQTQRIELPAGTHTVQLVPVDNTGRPLSQGQTRKIEIVDGKNEYLVAIAPDQLVFLAND